MMNKHCLNVTFAQRYSKTIIVLLLLVLVTVLLPGCGKKTADSKNQEPPPKNEATKPAPASIPATINEIDYSSYFKGRNGCAVFFTPSTNQYDIYNLSMSDLQRSPCSTFKIISSLFALESGVIDRQNSVRPWSGEQFWMSEWNQDLDFLSAFQSSCVWYFRQVIDDLGENAIKSGLAELDYGNQDISDWEGRLNSNNNNRALTGFWIESSLKISPKQQTEVMARIFEKSASYSDETINLLKEAMYVEQTDSCSIYGKTGSGKQNNVWVDAWFVGMIEREAGDIYFATYLGESAQHEISSKLAKEIAIEIAHDFY